LQLDHPHIVKLLSVHEHSKKTVIAMEYVAGRTLREHLLEFGALPDHLVWYGL